MDSLGRKRLVVVEGKLYLLENEKRDNKKMSRRKTGWMAEFKI